MKIDWNKCRKAISRIDWPAALAVSIATGAGLAIGVFTVISSISMIAGAKVTAEENLFTGRIRVFQWLPTLIMFFSGFLLTFVVVFYRSAYRAERDKKEKEPC